MVPGVVLKHFLNAKSPVMTLNKKISSSETN
jgi:hypothetical protein